MSGRQRITIAVALAVVGGVAALAVIAVGDSSGAKRAAGTGAPRPTRIVEKIPYLGKAITVRQVDPRRGLIFELESTPDLHGDGLTIKLTEDAPVSTRDAVRSHLLGATCRVKGHDVHEHVGRWDEHLDQFMTALSTDDRAVVIADAATSCVLYVGRPTDTPNTETFLNPPFSHVRLR